LTLPAAATSTPPGRNGLIAFVVHDAAGLGRGIGVIRPDGGGFRLLTRDRHDRSPAWSRDGRRLVFERAGSIYAIGANGKTLRRVAAAPRGGRRPVWSPNGRQLAFVRGGALFVMQADGSNQRRLYRRRGFVANHPSWSPDGRRIAFSIVSSAEGEGGLIDYGSIVVTRSSGGGLLYVTDGRGEPADDEKPGDRAQDGSPDWSPDGTRILFTRLVWLCPRCDQNEVFSVNVEDFAVSWLTTDTSYSAWAPGWSPDGTRIVASTSDGLAIFTAAGARLRTLPRRGSSAAWQPLR
jgi:Tol biopolymer transport system component